MFVWILEAVCVVAGCDRVHRFADLVYIDKRTDDDQAAENVPEPVGGGAEISLEAACARFVADTLGDLMEPDDAHDAAGDFLKQEEDEAVVHGLLAVASGSGEVQILADAGPEYDAVNTAGKDRENNVFPKLSLRVHRLHRHGNRLLYVRCVAHKFYHPFALHKMHAALTNTPKSKTAYLCNKNTTAYWQSQ